MQSLSKLKHTFDLTKKPLRVLFSDIDGTITKDGQIHSNAYQALWNLQKAGIDVVPITGRPAGFCEQIARFWPVKAVIGENGAFYFSYKNKKMFRHYVNDPSVMNINRKKLDEIASEVLSTIPGTALASDQFCRLFDLSIDFAEDVPPLSKALIEKITSVFSKHGATSKVSHIHVNGWFGDYSKVSMCQILLEKEFGFKKTTSRDSALLECTFVGDSPNDEPMFEFLPLTFGVSNVASFKDEMKFFPTFIASKPEGDGFCEIVETLLR